MDTLRVLPWAKNSTATVINDCYYEDGSAVDISPRQVLRNILEAYQEKNLSPVVAPELEFYLVKRNTDPTVPLEPPIGRSGRQETVRQPFSIDALDEFEPVIEDIYQYADSMGIKIDTLEHEMGTAQLEINFEHGEAMQLCDHVIMFKRIVREAAMRHNIYATFMAKPMQAEPGSAMHWHISILDIESNDNIFSDDEDRETELFKHFIGGLQTYFPEAILFNAPYVNSYRRFTRWQNAPINIYWGYDNRTTGLRVPSSEPEHRRIENRIAGADVNPYLSIAASLACGYLGMQEEIKPSAPEDSNAYNLPFTLPNNLSNAIEMLEGSEAIQMLFGERFLQIYLEIKKYEYQKYFAGISSWEREFLLLNV
jgi:glutamine synthetase